MKILLLEDDYILNNSIVKYLEATGHLVKSYREGTSALKQIKDETFDLFILDINVPGIDGLTLLEKIKDLKIQTPSIFISALIDIQEISRAFDLGCYDYLKKPFHLKELSIRIDKMLKSHSKPQEHTRLSKAYTYDANTNILYFYNAPQVISNRQLQIISFLALNRGTIVSYDTLRDYVWDNYDIDKSTITAEVNRLKKNLKEDFITNHRSIGYMIDRIN